MATPAQLKALAKGRAKMAALRKKKAAKKPVKKVTAKKAPTKRTQKRRARPRVAGYSPNPSKAVYTVYAARDGDIVAYWDGSTFDTDRYKQALYATASAAKSVAENLATKIKAGYRVGYGRESDPIKK